MAYLPRLTPPLTTGLIIVCIITSWISGLGSNLGKVAPLFISLYLDSGLAEIMAGEVWRLLTPIFIHFGVLHLLFNVLWLWDLGGALEITETSWKLALLVTVIGIISNLAQYALDGPFFGGMSGVVYGLLGYIWMQHKYNPRSQISLRKPIIVWMLAWYIICWTGLVGSIANMAHTAGLIAGLAWGLGSALSHNART